MGESEMFLLSPVQTLAINISVSFSNLNDRVNQIETNIEENILKK